MREEASEGAKQKGCRAEAGKGKGGEQGRIDERESGRDERQRSLLGTLAGIPFITAAISMARTTSKSF